MVFKDRCCWCDKPISITDETKVVMGSKTQLEWYVCKKCVELAEKGFDVVLSLVKDADEEYYEEDLASEVKEVSK